MTIKSLLASTLILTLFFACANKTQLGSTGESSVAEVDTLPTKLSQNIAACIIQNNISLVSSYFPTIDIFRYMLAGKPDTLSAEEVRLNMLEPLKDRFTSAVLQIQDEIEKENIDRAKLKFKDFVYFQTTERIMVPRVVEVKLDYDGSEVVIPVTVLFIHNKWYLLEILNTYNRFKH